MADVRMFSLLGLVTLVVTCFLARRIVFSWSTIGVFMLTNTLFVTLGVLSLPWVWNDLNSWFTAFDLQLIRPDAVRSAIVLTVGGPTLALLGYQLTHLIASRGRLMTSAPNLLVTNPTLALGFSPMRLLLGGGVVLMLGWAFILTELPTVMRGVREGWIAGDPSVTLEARRGATDNYFFVVIVYNIAPFVTVALWMYARRVGGWFVRAASLFAVASTTVFLLAVFQKRPLLLFLLTLALAEYASRVGRQVAVSAPARRASNGNLGRTLRLIVVGSTLFGVLIVLYYLSTNVRTMDASFLDVLGLLAAMASQRVLGRLALPVAMYTEYFPTIDPHYGFSNIALIASILETPIYADPKIVFEHFTSGPEQGSLAASALTDLFGAFGWSGWLVGALALGALLNRVDMYLARRTGDVANRALVIFMFVFAYYLSQASLPRSLLGYGGVFFVATWWLLRLPQPSAPAFVAATAARPLPRTARIADV
jgi:hypothetical protein